MQPAAGHFVPMVNSPHSINGPAFPQFMQPPGNLIVSNGLQFYVTYPGQQPLIPTMPHYVQQYPAYTAPVPPPSAQYVPVVDNSARKTDPQPKRRNKAIPIVDPNDKLKKEIPKSDLRENAPDFVPCKSSIPSNDDSKSIETEDDEQKELDATLSPEKELSGNLSFLNDEKISITEGIRQIPSNLEQELNQVEEIGNQHSIQPSFPKEQIDLASSFPEDSFQKRMRGPYRGSHSQGNFHSAHNLNYRYNNGPKRFDNHHDRQSFQNFNKHSTVPYQGYRQNNNNHNHFQRNYTDFHRNHENNPRSNYGNDNWKQHSSNNFHKKPYVMCQKIDQQVTALIKDENQNIIESEADETKELKDLDCDLNNNEVINENASIEEQSSIVEFSAEIVAESTAENSEGSMNLSWRYTTDQLRRMKTSPLVLATPPNKKDILLDSKLDNVVWKKLFTTSLDCDTSNDCQDSSFSNKSMNTKKSNSFRNDRNDHGQLSRTKSHDNKQLIKVNLSIKEEVKLNEAANAWKPSHVNKTGKNMNDKQVESQGLLKNFRSLLNKLTVENFDQLINEINDKRKYSINTPEKLSSIVELLFEKSISEPGYAAIYAKLCKELSTVHVFTLETTSKNPWKIHLITRCQQEFERSTKDDIIFKDIQERIKNTTDKAEIENLEECYFKLRQRANGTIKFIGELYKISMITANIMRSCIEGLLRSVTEENIERLCKLLTTIGEKLDNELRLALNSEMKPANIMNGYMRELEKLKNSNVITTLRIKFDIMNVIDLRKANWTQRINSRSTETKPQKLQHLHEEEEKRKKMQQVQLQDYNDGQRNKSMQNSGGRQKIQNRCDNDGFRMQPTSRFDFQKLTIPKKNDQVEMTLGPPRFLYQNFNKVLPQTAPQPTVSNAFANLSTDCDDLEELPVVHHTRSGSGKNGRKDGRNNKNPYNSNNNNYNKPPSTNQVVKEILSRKNRTPSPEPISEDLDDDFFMIDLTEKEENDVKMLMTKMQQVYAGKITYDMLLADLSQIKITKNVLGSVFNELFDKKSDERSVLVEILSKIAKNGLTTEIVNIEALKLSLKSIPSIICDVPHAYDYFTDYCVTFVQCHLIKHEHAKDILENQPNLIEKLSSKIVESELSSSSECSLSPETTEYESSVTALSECDSPKVKIERCLQKLMDKIKFKLNKRLTENYLEEIFSLIDEEQCEDVLNFIKDLTKTLLKASYEKIKKKCGPKKTVELSKLFPILIRYINNDFFLQLDCVEAIYEFTKSSKSENIKLCNLFDLFYENDVISTEAFKQWKKNSMSSTSKRETIAQAASFFLKLDEHDLSDDFNCTSSTIKE